MSAQPCGCDLECKPKPHVCERHRDKLQDGGTEWSCPHCGKDILFECKCREDERERALSDYDHYRTTDRLDRENQTKSTKAGHVALPGKEIGTRNVGPSRSSQIGPGEAPTRATTLPSESAARKTYPIASGVLDYFPDAICAVAHVSYQGNEQHNPGQPLHWARGKSTDDADTLMRHFVQRGTLDTDGIRHSAKVAWRALALLQKEIEAEHTPDQTQSAARACPQDGELNCCPGQPDNYATCAKIAAKRKDW